LKENRRKEEEEEEEENVHRRMRLAWRSWSRQGELKRERERGGESPQGGR
jgi:hypothetical protein